MFILATRSNYYVINESLNGLQLYHPDGFFRKIIEPYLSWCPVFMFTR